MNDFAKIAGALPPESDRNGLDAIATEAMKNPTELRPVLLWVDCRQITVRPDTGDRIAMLRIRRAEPVDGKDAETLRRIYMRAVERRTGKQPLPIDFDETDAAFRGGAQP